MTRRTLALGWLCLLAISSHPTSGWAKSMRSRAEAYAKRNQLPFRRVQLGMAGRKVNRVIVPVLPHTAEDFANEFSHGNGAVVMRQSVSDAVHQSLLFGFGDGYGYGTNGGYIPFRYDMRLQFNTPAGGYVGQTGSFNFDHSHPNWNPAFGGRYVVMQLDRGQIDHLRRYLDSGQRGQAWGACNYGGCLWWLVHAQTGPNEPLAWAVGVKQSKAPEVLINKVVHAGNERVQVIGVGVQNVDQFQSQTDAQLLGAAPPMGAAEASR